MSTNPIRESMTYPSELLMNYPYRCIVATVFFGACIGAITKVALYALGYTNISTLAVFAIPITVSLAALGGLQLGYRLCLVEIAGTINDEIRWLGVRRLIEGR